MHARATYKAFLVEERPDGSITHSIRQLDFSELPEHDTLIRVHYSSLNYKDALSATGHKGVTRTYPHVPGIDAAGIVEETKATKFSAGDAVLVTGYDLGQNTPGGYAEYIRVPSDWVVPLPAGMTLKDSMILGTAGFTAAYGVHKLQLTGISPGDGPVLVTGATGGVGSLAVAILAQLNYRVLAATGKTGRASFLHGLGAHEVTDRDNITGHSSKPLLSSRWLAAIDTVGGSMLDNVLRQTSHNGTVACCGNVLGGELNTSIYPFILRGVSLMGIDSGNCLMPMRKTLWNRLANRWKPDSLHTIYHEILPEDLGSEIKKILRGDQAGRIIVNLKSGN